MNTNIRSAKHPSVRYYDGDYPAQAYIYPENFDQDVARQGIMHDIELYKPLGAAYGRNILELCCGTGRIALPLMAAGHAVTAVDNNAGLLDQLRTKAGAFPAQVVENLTIIEQDVTVLSLPKKDYDVIIGAFNSLLCIPDFDLQQRTLLHAAGHLRRGGCLALDIANPLALNLWGDEYPEPMFTRRNPHNGNTYTRFAAVDPMDINQVQRVYGWYEETDGQGVIQREDYELYWRPIFRREAIFMLEKAGFYVDSIVNSHNGEALDAESPAMFIKAIRI